ncbi:hypothetical protein POTOM_026308 [Populus tomentosa]|uniref:Tocopherol cyclase n=1 Tax=Populus tomentosa TaxID=118781 RepID=A0A8X7ZKC7_POPTO|nr:hypothetical protein POTOM_026308 [Populus tomentosa]
MVLDVSGNHQIVPPPRTLPLNISDSTRTTARTCSVSSSPLFLCCKSSRNVLMETINVLSSLRHFQDFRPCRQPLKQSLFKSQLKSVRVPAASNKETLTVEAESASSDSPVYVHTPTNRELRTPHSGYHFDGTLRRFFEGWYFKVSIPERKQNFCIIYTVENPAFQKKLTGLEVAQYGPRSTGVGAQVLGADDKFIFQYSEESQNFWGSRHELMLGNTFVVQKDMQPPTKEVPPQVDMPSLNSVLFIINLDTEFNRRVLEGFQVSPFWHQGFIRDNGRTDYVRTVKTARWEYRTRPIYGWGSVGSKQNSTAGWLAAFPVFEPHWQICMASGLSTGIDYEPSCCSRGQEGLSWIEWEGERFEFKDAPSYSEKNWGGAFPRKWFWVKIHLFLHKSLVVHILKFHYGSLLNALYISATYLLRNHFLLQCNVFEGTSGEVTLTAAGGLRQLPGPAGSEIHENAALIGVHSDGIFYEFVPWNGVVNWEISPWGYWHMSAENEKHLVELEARAKDLGTPILAPTVEAGLAPACIDACSGVLKLQMWERRQDGTRGKVILKVTSDMAAVEVGGGPWFTNWKGKTSAPELLRRALRVPIDLDAVYSSVPFFKPPGL